MQTFKFTHMTAIYDGGKYTLTADKGYSLRHRTTGETANTVTTKDYTLYETLEGEVLNPEQEAEKNRKAMATLSTIFKMAHDQNKLADDDERMEAVDAKLKEKYPEAGEDNVPPIEDVLALLRENGLGDFADAFDLAWADKEFTQIIDAMPELPADKPADETDDEADGDNQDGQSETAETPAEQPTDETPTDEQPVVAEALAEKPKKTSRKK